MSVPDSTSRGNGNHADAGDLSWLFDSSDSPAAEPQLAACQPRRPTPPNKRRALVEKPPAAKTEPAAHVPKPVVKKLKRGEVDVRPQISDPEKELLFAAMLRRKHLFLAARPLIDPEFFAPDEMWLKLVWLVLSKYYDDFEELPTVGLLGQLCNAQIEMDPYAIDGDDNEKLDTLLDLADKLREEDFPDTVAHDALRRFCDDRLFFAARSSFANMLTPIDVTNVIAGWYQRAADIRAVGGNATGIVSAAELVKQHSSLHPPVIDGMARAGEVMNIISYSKVGKSWLLYSLLLCVTAGMRWLGRFPTKRGRVLLIDNELHPETLAMRIRHVANKLGIDDLTKLDVLTLRGNLCSLDELQQRLARIPPDTYCLIAIDAKYRMTNDADNENDNSAETRFYNMIDKLAGQTGALIVLVHHASKGNQSDRRVTDVGAGAGAQSRAADTHVILREHEEDGTVVLDGAVRSFPPLEPLALRWEFPLWQKVDGVDTSKLKGRSENAQQKKDEEGRNTVLGLIRVRPRTVRELRTETGMRRDRMSRLVSQLQQLDKIVMRPAERGGQECPEFILTGSEEGSTT